MYIDPGYGALAIQALIGFLIAVPTLLVIFRHKVVAFFRRKKHGKDS